MQKLSILMLLTLPAFAETIYPTDSAGNRQFNQQSYKTEGKRIVPTDNAGNREYGKC